MLETLLTRDHLRGQTGKSLGAWAWGLLGRCREVGEMGSEEVGVLRLVGKQAVWLLRRMKGGGAWCGEETGGLGEVDDDGHEDGGLGEEAGIEDPPAVMEEDRIVALEGGLDAGIEEDASNTLARARHRLLSTLHPSSTPPSSPPPPTVCTDITKETTLEAVTMSRTEDEAGKAETGEGQMQSVQATLDMLVTIIGSCYGQRDLLEGRLLWDEL